MPIGRNEDYGIAAPLSPGSPVVGSDAELRALVLDSRSRGERLPVVGLVGGDLCRTLGGRGDVARLSGPDARTVPVDLGIVTIDGEPTVFVAHLLVGRFLAGGTVVAQAQWLGPLDIGPRSHPCDGLLDVTTGRLPLGQRRAGRRRARSGTHLPHPDLSHQRTDRLVVERERPLPVTIDGVRIGRHRRLEIGLEPDALSVVV